MNVNQTNKKSMIIWFWIFICTKFKKKAFTIAFLFTYGLFKVFRIFSANILRAAMHTSKVV